MYPRFKCGNCTEGKINKGGTTAKRALLAAHDKIHIEPAHMGGHLLAAIALRLIASRPSVDFRVSLFIFCTSIVYACPNCLRPRRTATHLFIKRSFSLDGKGRARFIHQSNYQAKTFHLSEEHTY